MTANTLRRSRPIPRTPSGAVQALLAAFFAVLVVGCGGSADAPPPTDIGSPPALVAPQVTSQPVDASVSAPATATFTAAATGTPAPTVQWQRSGDGGTTWLAIVGATSAAYTTPATTASDNGALFRAVFSNSSGSATTGTARLTVITPSGAGLALLAGGVGGAGNLDGIASDSRFNKPTGIAIDSAGNLYVADTGNQTIRRITPAGIVSVFAGRTGIAGGADGPATQATFSSPTGVAVDPTGIVYVADWGGGTIRKITPGGVVSTLAGSFGMADRIDGQGSVARFVHPYGITISAGGTLYVTDQVTAEFDTDSSIRAVTASGAVTTDLFLGSSIPYGIVAIGADPVLYFSALSPAEGGLLGTTGSVLFEEDVGQDLTYPIAGGPVGNSDGQGAAAAFDFANGLALNAAGDIFAADMCNDTIRHIVPDPSSAHGTARVTSLAGLPTTDADALDGCVSILAAGGQSVDGTGAAATFNNPTGLVADASGNLYVVDQTSSVVRKVTPLGVVTTIAGAAFQIGSTDGPGPGASFGFNEQFFPNPQGATAIDASGTVFVADTWNHEIRKITANGQVSTVAGSAEVFDDIDGIGAAASFKQPAGIAVDAAGNLFVADDSGCVIRKITPAAVVSTIAGISDGRPGSNDGVGTSARFNCPMGIALDAAGNLYVADRDNHAIRKISPQAVVSTLAGSAAVSGGNDGTGAAASFTGPTGIGIDAAGNVYVADPGNHTIRKVTAGGVVTTLAGAAGQQGSTDGDGTSARFNAPTSVAVDSSGNVYVADSGNDAVRKITPAGVVSTLIGVVGMRGVRLGTDPRLDNPQGLSISGNTLVLISAGAVLRYTLP